MVNGSFYRETLGGEDDQKKSQQSLEPVDVGFKFKTWVCKDVLGLLPARGLV